MTPIRLVILAILLTALAAGVAMYWLQVHAFYREAEAPAAVPLFGPDGPLHAPRPEAFQGIERDSSPISYRACLRLPLSPAAQADLPAYGDPRPPHAPGWFDCFDARAIGEAIAAGEARAVHGGPLAYGLDRVVALFPDGRAYGWNQFDACGEALYSGDSLPRGCPPVPESD